MVSRRNFLSICLMMATIMLLFQFSILSKDLVNNYDENVYLYETGLDGDDAWSPLSADENTGRVVLIGDENSPSASTVKEWCTYSRRLFSSYDSVGAYIRSYISPPELLCITAEAASEATAAQINYLRINVINGLDVFFCELPEPSVIAESENLKTLLGIREMVDDQAELIGIRLYPGFLLGGETIYTVEEEEEKTGGDVEMTAPWYSRLSGTKCYMAGLLEDESVENEDLPALLWRNSIGTGRVFAVNGPYMQDETGLGILSAAIYELNDYSVYPVVNAQNLSVASFPVFSDENTEELMEIYARDLKHFQNTIMWPNLILAASKGGYKATDFVTPRLDYSSGEGASSDELEFYLRQLREQDYEAGISMDRVSDTEIPQKAEYDSSFFGSSGSSYAYGAAYVRETDREGFLAASSSDILKNVRTVTGIWDKDNLLSYWSKDVVAQGITADGFEHTYLQDLKTKALETSLGYSNILLDMKNIVWPEENDQHWEILSEKLASNINTFWNPFKAFEKTTVSESGARVRNFLSVKYSDSREGDEVTLNVGSEGAHWFIFRTHYESLEEIEGGEFTKIEEDAYLISTTGQTVKLRLKERRKKQFYIP